MLYAQGMSLSDIADVVGVDTSTISRWKSSDEGSSADWDEARDGQLEMDPIRLLNTLKKHRHRLAEQGPQDEPTKWADAIWKIERVIDQVREEIEDVETQLAVLQGMAVWAREELPDDRFEPVRDAIMEYGRHLKEEASE